MTAEETLYGWLAADAQVQAMVGDRIYPARAPTGAALPLITYQVSIPFFSGHSSNCSPHQAPCHQRDAHSCADFSDLPELRHERANLAILSTIHHDTIEHT